MFFTYFAVHFGVYENITKERGNYILTAEKYKT